MKKRATHGCLPILGGFVVIVVLLVVAVAISSGDGRSKESKQAADMQKILNTHWTSALDANGASILAAPTDTTPPDAPNTPDAPTYTDSQQNAIDSAQQYLSTMPFSKAGLIKQLASFEGFPHADAVFAVNHLDGVDWTDEAYQSAQQYLSTDSFSLAGLINQLESFEGFTHAQAVAGATRAYKEK